MDIGMNLPGMLPGLDRATIEAWCRGIDEGPWSSLALGERINFPNPDLTVTLGFAAAITRRVRIHYNVLVLPLHHEVLAAKQVATLDMLSGGRVTLAVGVGGREEDYRALDREWTGKRLDRIEAQVARMRRIWAGEKAYPGALGPVEPFPARPGGPPILSGSLFPQSIRRAAAWADGLCGFSFGMDTDEVTAVFDQARAAWREAGRATPPRLVTGCWFALGPDAREQMDGYLRRYLSFLGDAAEYVIPTVRTTSAAELRDAAARARDAGTDELLLVATTRDPADLMRAAEAVF